MGGDGDDDGCAVDVWQDLFRVHKQSMERRTNEGLCGQLVVRARAESFGRDLSVTLTP